MSLNELVEEGNRLYRYKPKSWPPKPGYELNRIGDYWYWHNSCNAPSEEERKEILEELGVDTDKDNESIKDLLGK